MGADGGGKYIEILENRQGVRIACVEEMALHMGCIDAGECHKLGEQLGRSPYGQYVMTVSDTVPEGDLVR